MNNLITAIEFSTFRNISKKLDTAKIDEAISLAQQSDLIGILGEFYFDVINNKDEPEWGDLLNGDIFTYNNEEFEHSGIKRLLADYAYSRFIYMINVNLTPFGAVSKIMNNSEKIERNTIKDIAKQAQIDAGIKFKFIEKYIFSKPILFKRYCNKKSNTNFLTQKFSRL